MDVAQFVRTESSALADRILSAVEEQAAAARARADAELREARGQIDILRADLEGVTARALALEADLDSVIAAHAEVDAARVRAEADLRGARDLLERALREADALREALAHHSSQLALAQDDLASARGTVGAVEEERRALDDRNRELAERLAESGKTVEALRDELAEARETARQRAADADAAAAALHERFETELAARQAEAQRTAAELATLRAHAATLQSEHEVLVVERDALRAEAEAFRRLAERTEAEVELLRRQAAGRAGDGAGGARLLQEAVRALDALSEATSVEALFETLARQVGTHVSRVAVFRVRGHHLEGEYGVGFESAGEIAKLMIPFGVDSLLARAATSGTLVRAAAEQLGETPPPVGGTAAAALAVPLMLHGQALAVLYADSPEAVTDAQAAIALLLARQAATVLSRLARELKTVEELREYAALLVDEAQHIFHADLESGCSEPERLRRLRDSIDCARQLFAQRAALESPSVAALFEKHLASIADAGSPFGRALLDLVERPESQRTAAS